MENSRPIRFRAWDKDNREMKTVTQLEFDIKGNLILGSFGWYGVKEHLGNYILMQFTGLSDKNGTEIYVGDRLQDSIDSDIGVVYWKESAAGFYVKWGDGSDMSLNYGVATCKCEIIGNIHTN